MSVPPPLRVLIAGGGVAALETVLALRALAGDRVKLELLAPDEEFVERPLAVLTPFGGAPAPTVSLERLTELGVTRHRGALTAVDVEEHEVRVTEGGELHYDRLVIATGAQSVDAVKGAITFHGPASAEIVERAIRGAHSHVLFVVPPGAGWPLPLYELALLTINELVDGPGVTVVTPEPRPLDLFGQIASDALARLLDRAGVKFVGCSNAAEALETVLVTDAGRMLAADAIIALPRLVGHPIAGVPANVDGFIEIDEHARVVGLPDVFAAGDATAEPVKQGGLATQQADAAAEAIAADAGAPVSPRPLRRILRGVVLTGEAPLYLRRDLDEDITFTRPLRGAPTGVSRAGLWWPSGKIAGRYLTGFLSEGGVPGDRLADRPPKKPRPAVGR